MSARWRCCSLTLQLFVAKFKPSWKYLKQRSLICGVIDDHSRSFKAIDKRLFWCKSKFRKQLKPWRNSLLAASSCTRPEDNKQQLIWKCLSFKEYFWHRKPRFRKIFARKESNIWNRLTHKVYSYPFILEYHFRCCDRCILGVKCVYLSANVPPPPRSGERRLREGSFRNPKVLTFALGESHILGWGWG